MNEKKDVHGNFLMTKGLMEKLSFFYGREIRQFSGLNPIFIPAPSQQYDTSITTKNNFAHLKIAVSGGIYKTGSFQLRFVKN